MLFSAQILEHKESNRGTGQVALSRRPFPYGESLIWHNGEGTTCSSNSALGIFRECPCFLHGTL